MCYVSSHTHSAANLRQLNQIPSKVKQFFPDPVWKGDGTTWEVFMRTCPPNSAVRKMLTSMTNKVVHLADVMHVSYNGTKAGRTGKKRTGKVPETVNEGEDVQLEINGKSPSRRRRSLPQNAESTKIAGAEEALLAKEAPDSKWIPTRDVYVNTQDFQFLANRTSLSHDQLCNDSRTHDTQGQFCSDFRSLDSLYPVFSPSTMAGFADIVIPSRELPICLYGQCTGFF